MLSSPLLDAGQMKQLEEELAVRRIDLTFLATGGVEGARSVLEYLRQELASLPAGQGRNWLC